MKETLKCETAKQSNIQNLLSNYWQRRSPSQIEGSPFFCLFVETFFTEEIPLLSSFLVIWSSDITNFFVFLGDLGFCAESCLLED